MSILGLLADLGRWLIKELAGHTTQLIRLSFLPFLTTFSLLTTTTSDAFLQFQIQTYRLEI